MRALADANVTVNGLFLGEAMHESNGVVESLEAVDFLKAEIKVTL